VAVAGVQMSRKKILFVGCSHTADSGFTEENQVKYHWPWLISQHYNCYFHNAGFGGSSNDEIFYRTSELVLQNSFDLVIVMWSDIGRKWVYFNENNVDDFTIINYGNTVGYNSSSPELKKYTKLHYAHFNNEFINIKHWVMQTLLLASLLKERKLKFLFIKGFDNYTTDIINSSYSTKNGFILSNSLKKFLDFNHRPDYYILQKLLSLKTLTDLANQSYWFNFDSHAFISPFYCVDVADDNSHPGIESNKKLYLDLVNYVQREKIFW
jgi:hypothetical protein